MMKKIVTALFFLHLLSTSSFGQDGELRFGFQLSPSFSWMRTNDVRINHSGTNVGMKLGMLTDYYFRENYAFSTGIGFAFNHGGTLLFDYGGNYWTRSNLGPALDSLPNGVKLRYNLQFVEIPLMVKMRTNGSGNTRYFLEPGLTLGFRTQARGSVTGVGVGEEAQKLDIRREVNGLNLAWGITGGAETAISSNISLITGVGFQIGFTDVTDDKGGVIFDPNRGNQKETSKGAISALTLKIGLMF
jgi:hypothetical protein